MGTIPTARKCNKCNRFYKALFNKGYYMLCWCDSCDAIVVILKNGVVIFLDNVVLRLGLAKSQAHARQLVSHAYFLVNGKSVNIPSFQVKRDDVIKLKETKKKKTIFKDLSEKVKKAQTPYWLNLDKEKFEGKVVGEPSLSEVNLPVEISLIFEFYSR